jgi:exosortase
MNSSAVPDTRRAWAAAAIVGTAFAATYAHVFRKLVFDWSTNENYSHGFLIIPVAAYLTWERRPRLARVPAEPRLIGLVVILLGLGALGAGTLGVELFMTRISILPVLAGIVLFFAGWRHLRILAFPIAFLLLMIPLPAIVFNEIALPLQLIASRLGEGALRLVGIPVLREGNVIHLANTALQVAEACSGIRSLVSLLTLSIIYSYFAESGRVTRLVMIVATVPIAIATNGMRVAAIGVAAYSNGAAAAEGVFHTVSGWMVFVLAFALLLLLHLAMKPMSTLLRAKLVPAL